MSGVVPPELIKIGELARRSGVPIATLKHYLREGLIAPARKTGRTMQYYDASLATTIRSIKDLQRDQRLPLHVIKETVAAGTAPIASDDLAAAEAIANVLAKHGGDRTRTRDELIARGVSPRQLEWLAQAGLAVPDADGTYRGDDLAILATLGDARASGITPKMLPFEILGEYLVALRALVDVELRMFRAGVLAHATPSQVGPLADAATRLSERLVVLLRRKLIVPTLHALSEEATDARAEALANPAPARPASRTRRVRKLQRRRK